MARPSVAISNFTGTAEYAEAIDVSSSDADFGSVPCRRLSIGGAGNLKVQMASDGAQVTYVGLAAGTEKNGRFAKVISSGTTATSIIAEW